MLMDFKLKCVFEMLVDSSSQVFVVKVKVYSYYYNDSFFICYNLVDLFLLKKYCVLFVQSVIKINFQYK